MITVTNGFVTKASGTKRHPQKKFEVDWDVSNTYVNETVYVKVIEVERGIEEPLGGVSLAQCDVRLFEPAGRFVPDDN